MKKLNRKLIPAFAMLLLSAVLMSTASFAWFSSNSQVTATGMVVSANAPAALWISTDADSGFTTSIDLEAEAEKLMPATVDVAGIGASVATEGQDGAVVLPEGAVVDKNGTHNAASWVFHTLNNTGYGAVDNAGGLGKNGDDRIDLTAANVATHGTVATNGTGTDAVLYYLAQTFYLRLEGKNDNTGNENSYEAKTLNATITLTGNFADDIYKALRVAVVTNGTNVGDSVTTQESVGGYQVFGFNTAPTTNQTTNAKSVGGDKVTAQSSTNLLTLAAQETVAVQVYIWFEGNDTDCTNNNSNFIEEYGVTIDFH